MKQPKIYVKKYNKIFDVLEIHFDINVVYFDDGIKDGYIPIDFNDIDFIYNTGYKDKNDNYIFTGDIVVHNNLKYVARKKTEEEFYYLEKNGKYYCRLSIMEDDYSVVGNIYENKDLLED